MNAENNMTIDVKDLNLDPKKYEAGCGADG